MRLLGIADRRRARPRVPNHAFARALRSLEFVCMDHIPSIGSVMTPFPFVVQVDDSVLAARALMVEH